MWGIKKSVNVFFLDFLTSDLHCDYDVSQCYKNYVLSAVNTYINKHTNKMGFILKLKKKMYG